MGASRRERRDLCQWPLGHGSVERVTGDRWFPPPEPTFFLSKPLGSPRFHAVGGTRSRRLDCIERAAAADVASSIPSSVLAVSSSRCSAGESRNPAVRSSRLRCERTAVDRGSEGGEDRTPQDPRGRPRVYLGRHAQPDGNHEHAASADRCSLGFINPSPDTP